MKLKLAEKSNYSLWLFIDSISDCYNVVAYLWLFDSIVARS